MKTILAHIVAFGRRGRMVACKGVGKLAERGMVTAEYAVGILAAIALALVLVKVFKADGFLTKIVDLISFIFGKLLGWIPGG